MGQQHSSVSGEGGHEAASYMAQSLESVGGGARSQVQGHREGQGQSQVAATAAATEENNCNWLAARQMAARKMHAAPKEPPVSTVTTTTSSSSTPSESPATSAASSSRPSRFEIDPGRMSVREAIDSFIESRLSACSDSPPPQPLSGGLSLSEPPPESLIINGAKDENSWSSGQADDPVVIVDHPREKRKHGEMENISHGSSKVTPIIDIDTVDAPVQSAVDVKEATSPRANDEAVDDEDSERLSDKELVIDCDDSPRAKENSESASALKDTDGESTPCKENRSPSNLSDASASIKGDSKEGQSKASDKSPAVGDEQKSNSPSGKQEKQTFSAYLQDKLKAQLASQVDNQKHSHLYFLDVHKSPPISTATPVSSTVARTGSVRLQTLIDKVLDQSIGKELNSSPSDIEHNELFTSYKKNSESPSSVAETGSSKMPPLATTVPKPIDSQTKADIGHLFFKDHIEKVVVENFLSYEQEEKIEAVRRKEERARSSPERKSNSGKSKRESGSVGSDGTISVQNIVDRVIGSQTEVISKLSSNDQTPERGSPGRSNSGSLATSGSTSSVSNAGSRTSSGNHSSSEGSRVSSGDNQQPPTVGRKRGRPRLSSPVSRPGAWPSDRSSGPPGDRGNAAYGDLPPGDYRGASMHGRFGSSVAPHVSQPRSAPGQGPPPLDIISSQGSIQQGIPVGAMVSHHLPGQAYHSQLHPPHLTSQHPSMDSNPKSSSAARPMLASSVPLPHSSHHGYRGMHPSGPHPHLSQPPSPHSLSQQQQQQHQQQQHQHRQQSDHHHPHHNKPLPPLIHANHLNEKTALHANTASAGSSRLVPVTHIPTSSCSCSNCVATFSRDKPPQSGSSSSLHHSHHHHHHHHQQQHQQQMRRGEAPAPYHVSSASKHSDSRRDVEPRPHPHHPHPYAVYDNAMAAQRGNDHHPVGSAQSESLKPVVGVRGKSIPPQAIIPSYVAACRPMEVPPPLESHHQHPHHAREEHYPRGEGKGQGPYPAAYSTHGGKTAPGEVASYPDDDPYHRGWPRSAQQQSEMQASANPALPYPSLEPPRRPPAGIHRRHSPGPDKAFLSQASPLNLQKPGYPPEAPLAPSPSVASGADQPLDLSVKPSASEAKGRDVESRQQPAAAYHDRAHPQRYPPTHPPPREPDPRDTYSDDVEGSGRGAHHMLRERADHAMDTAAHAYPSGTRTYVAPPTSHHLAPYPPHAMVSSKSPHSHPAQNYPRREGRTSAQQTASDRPYPNSSHLLSPGNQVASNCESPTQRVRHPYPSYPMSSSSSPSPSLQGPPPQPLPPAQQQSHPAPPQHSGMSHSPHVRGAVGVTHGGSPQYQGRSPYTDMSRQPKHQDPRAPSPHYPNVTNQRKTPEAHSYSSHNASNQESTTESRGSHTTLPPPPHPQPVVSPEDPESLKLCVSKHEPIQNIIGNHPQNDILYLICKLCRQTYGSPYGFRKHFRNQHGFEPKVEHTIVQTISATKTAMAHTGPGDQPMAEDDKKGIVEAQRPNMGDGFVSYKQDYPALSQGGDKHSHSPQSGPAPTQNTDDPKPVDGKVIEVKEESKADLKMELKSGDGKLEPGMEKTKFLDCPECGQSFQLNDFGSYKRHCRQHSVSQYSGPFSCHDCQKSFAEPGHLQQHLNTHTRFTPSLCGFCPTFFSSPHYLAVHLQAAHGHVVSSESLKKSPDEVDAKLDLKSEKPLTLDLHGIIENVLNETNGPGSSDSVGSADNKVKQPLTAAVVSSSQQENVLPASSSVNSLPLSKRHRMSVAGSDAPILTTVHTSKTLEVQKRPADAVVTTASPDSSYEEVKSQAADSQPRISTSGIKSGCSDLTASPSNCSNGHSQRESKESLYDSQDSNSNHSILSASGGSKRDDSNSRPGSIPGRTEISTPIDRLSNKDETESVLSERCQSVDSNSNSHSVGGSRTSSPAGDDAEKFYKHKKYSRHRKRMSSSDVTSEPETKTSKLSSNQESDQSSALTTVSSSASASTIVQVCESSSSQYEGKLVSGSESNSSQEDGSGSDKLSSKSGKSKESRQDDLSKSGDSKKTEVSKFKWERLTRSQTGKSSQAVSSHS